MTPKLFLILIIGLLATNLLTIIPAAVDIIHPIKKALGSEEPDGRDGRDSSSRTEIIIKANPSPSPSQSPSQSSRSTSESSFGSSSSSLSLSPTFNEQIRNRHNLDAVSSQELLNSGHITETSPSINDNSAATTADKLETQLHIADNKTGMVIDAGAGNATPLPTETENTTDLIKDLHLQRMQVLENTMKLLSLTTIGQPLQPITN